MTFFSMKNKVIINITTGEKIGLLRNCDLKVDEVSGRIEALLMPKSKLANLFSQENDFIEVPWNKIKKIGVDTIIVEL